MTRAFFIAVLCVATAADARARKPRPHRVIVAAAAKLDLSGSSEALLARAQSLYASADYTEVVQLGRELERRKDLTLDQKIEAYRLLGSALAIVEDPLDAEPVARRLFNLRPDYVLPAGTPAKIANAFTKVQREVREAIEQTERAQRDAQVQRMKLLDSLPQAASGGQPLTFAFRLLDPDSQIEKVVVHYRRVGQGAYSALALDRDPTGQWSGQLPAEQLSDATGFVLEHWVETSDASGPLLCAGSAAQPLKLSVSAGAPPEPRVKKPLSRGWFFTGLAGTLVSGAAVAGFGFATLATRSEQTSASMVAGSSFNALSARGNSYADATNVSWGVLIGFAAITVVLLFLTEWEP